MLCLSLASVVSCHLSSLTTEKSYVSSTTRYGLGERPPRCTPGAAKDENEHAGDGQRIPFARFGFVANDPGVLIGTPFLDDSGGRQPLLFGKNVCENGVRRQGLRNIKDNSREDLRYPGNRVPTAPFSLLSCFVSTLEGRSHGSFPVLFKSNVRKTPYLGTVGRCHDQHIPVLFCSSPCRGGSDASPTAPWPVNSIERRRRLAHFLLELRIYSGHRAREALVIESNFFLWCGCRQMGVGNEVRVLAGGRG